MHPASGEQGVPEKENRDQRVILGPSRQTGSLIQKKGLSVCGWSFVSNKSFSI